MKSLRARVTINRDKNNRSYESVIKYLKDNSFIPKDSAEIPSNFIKSESDKIRKKMSNLPADIRKIIIDLDM
jgi:hypothetical protein